MIWETLESEVRNLEEKCPQAYVHGGMPYMEPSLPIIDEEYSEYVAVYQAVPGHFSDSEC